MAVDINLWVHFVPPDDFPTPGSTSVFASLAELKSIIISNQEQIMAAIDNLKNDLADLISEAVTDLEAAIAKAQATSNDPAIDALDAQVKDTTATLKADFAKLTGTPVPQTP